MADPQRHARVLIDREPWSGRVLRQLTDAQTAHWRFRLFGPLTAPAARTVERPESPPMAVGAAKQTFA